MKSTRSLLMLLVAVAWPAALHAQGNLAWNDCITQTNAAENLRYACDGSAGTTPIKLVASFRVPATVQRFVGTQMWIAVETSNGNEPLPDFWRLGVGGCRSDVVDYPAREVGIGSGTTGACPSPWFPSLNGGGHMYNMDYLGSGRTVIQTARANYDKQDLPAGHYLDGVISILIDRDIETEGGSVCAGCCQPVTITLTNFNVYAEYIPGVEGSSVAYEFTTPDIRNTVHWTGCNGTGTTAVRTKSWGAVKATYR